MTTATAEASDPLATFELRHLEAGDGATLHRLVEDGGGLDVNTPYAYVLGARMFARTSVLATGPTGPAGFVYGIAPPADPSTLFVWQVGVAPAARGAGLARTMLHWLVDAVRPTHVEATVTPDNVASLRLFAGLARDLRTELEISRWADASDFGDSEHEPEDLHRIGPIPSAV